MAWDRAGWRQAVGVRLRELAAGMNQIGANSAYSYVALSSLLPVLHAMQSGEGAAALGALAASVGGNLLAEQLQRWQDRASTPREQATLAAEIVTRASQEPAYRVEVETLFQPLQVIQ